MVATVDSDHWNHCPTGANETVGEASGSLPNLGRVDCHNTQDGGYLPGWGRKFQSHLLEGKNLTSQTTLPTQGTRILHQIMDLNTGDLLYTRPDPTTTLNHPGFALEADEPNLNHLVPNTGQPLVVVTWEVN